MDVLPHGAYIGGGAWAHYTQNATATSYQFADTLDNGIPTTTQGSPHTVPAASKTCAGDIYINGGVLKPYSDMHGNAIGQGCCSWNEGYEIVITGGTVLPDTSKAMSKGGNPLTGCVAMGIGAQGGAVSVIGGSVRIGYVESTKSQEEGLRAHERRCGALGCKPPQARTGRLTAMHCKTHTHQDRGPLPLRTTGLRALPAVFEWPGMFSVFHGPREPLIAKNYRAFVGTEHYGRPRRAVGLIPLVDE